MTLSLLGRTASVAQTAVAEAAASLTQLWELLYEREGTSVKAAPPSGLLSPLFMFLLPRYPWRCHEQRVCFHAECSALAAPGGTSGSDPSSE